MKLAKNQSGFTLIELVVILVILGILGAVALVQYTNLTDSARDAALEGAFGAHASRLAIAVGLCRGMPAQATATGNCGPADFSGDFETTVYNAVTLTGSEIARSAYVPGSGTFKICSGSLLNGRFTTVTYNGTTLTRTTPAAWAAGATCDLAA